MIPITLNMFGNSVNKYANFINGAGTVYARYPAVTSLSTYAIWTRIRVTNATSASVAFSLGTIQLGTGLGVALYTRTGGGGNFLQIVGNNNSGGSNQYFPSNHTVVANEWIDCLILYKSSQFTFFINNGSAYTPAGTFTTASFNPYFTMGGVADNAGTPSLYFLGHIDFMRYYTDSSMTIANVQEFVQDNIGLAARRYEFSNTTRDSSSNEQHTIYEQNFIYGTV